MPAAQFHRCNSGRDCSSDAQCVPSLNGGNACICGPGLMGDGATCSPQPAFASGGEVPDAIKNGDCTPTRVDGDGARGQINRGPAVYCLQARRGVTYTITVRILPLGGVIREGINAILEAVTVGVGTTTIGSWITIIANTVAVTV